MPAFDGPMKSSHSRFVDVRGLRYHVREWGRAGAAPLVWLHGWMDVSASFQFVVDALRGPWHCLAPDWRGFGLTDWPAVDCYWFPDYLADLEFLLDALVGSEPVVLIGHSMGGNIALLYAGIRPQRIRGVVNLEGFGLRDVAASAAPARYARWIGELKAGAALREYDALSDVVQRLRKTNPKLSEERALFLAAHWSQPTAEGRYRIAGDPAHRIVNPVPYRWAEVEACWSRVVCPVLWVQARETDALKWAGDQAEIDRRRAGLANCEAVWVEDAGHMLHHDRPDVVARLIEDFLGRAG